MAVVYWDYTSVEQVRSLRTGNEITRPVTVLTQLADDSLATLKRDLPQLQKWQPHPTEAGFFVEEFAVNRIKDTLWWEGYVRWTDTLVKNPLDEPARLLGVRTETLPSATVFNAEDQAILNTAGDVVSPIPKPERIRIFTFVKNLPDVAQWLFDLEDVVNDSALRIGSQMCAERTLLLRSVEVGEADAVEDLTYRPHTLQLAYRKSTWKHRFPSTGWNQLVEERDMRPGSPTLLQTIKVRRPILIQGQPPSQEQLLDADGRWIREPEPADLVILEEDIYKAADLTVLPLY